jgi:hypothetical protein
VEEDRAGIRVGHRACLQQVEPLTRQARHFRGGQVTEEVRREEQPVMLRIAISLRHSIGGPVVTSMGLRVDCMLEADDCFGQDRVMSCFFE